MREPITWTGFPPAALTNTIFATEHTKPVERHAKLAQRHAKLAQRHAKPVKRHAPLASARETQEKSWISFDLTSVA